jgi:amidohydrolase
MTPDKQLSLWIDDFKQWRHHLHSHPETAFAEFKTAAFVEEKLRSFGVDELHTGFARTGIVAAIYGQDPKSDAIGFRADLDALDVLEKNTFEHCSKHVGKMHACGHDGHTVMLLAAARYLTQNRNFKGTVYCIFQPAEENEGGGILMVDEGLFDKFPMKRVYGMHNWPGLDAGSIAVHKGPVMAAADRFDLVVRGKGGHAAMPHLANDPLVTAAHLVAALQQVHSRRMNPLDQSVISITQFHAGEAYNVIPDQAVIKASVRTYKTEVRDLIISHIKKIAEGICAAGDCTFEFIYREGYPPTINDFEAADIAAKAAVATVGQDKVLLNMPPSLASEDFGVMLENKAGCYVWIGNGPGTGGCMLHNPHYDFNDSIVVAGAGYWINLVKEELSN